jgi:alpha-1,2-glucosyltransferase
VTLGFLKPFSELYAFGEEAADRICPTAMLRFVNLLFACANAYLIFVINCTLHPNESSSGDRIHSNTNLLISSISLATFPLLFFFNFLFYTDPGSLFFVLLMYLYHLNRSEWLASFFGAISLLFRQTNIIWLFFVASYTSLQILNANIEKLRKKNTRSRVMNSIALQICYSCGGYMITGLLYLTFILMNRGNYSNNYQKHVLNQILIVVCTGIVLGDRSAHTASLNLPQFLYFVAFCSIFGWPWTSHPSNFKSFISLFRSEMRYCLIVCYITIAIILKNMSVAHPYLLADNRHYTFYIWRRFLSIKQPVEVLIFPILYIYCGCAMFFSLKQRDNLWKCLFFASAAMALIPQSLLEFRYFMIPFMIWRLNSTTISVKQYVMELAFNAALDLLTIYIFMYKKFRWDGHDGHQRFMW